MKKVLRKLRNRKSVSAVIGVILMVTITVAIASTVYLYVSGFFVFNEYEVNRTITSVDIKHNSVVVSFEEGSNITLHDSYDSFLKSYQFDDEQYIKIGCQYILRYRQLPTKNILIYVEKVE